MICSSCGNLDAEFELEQERDGCYRAIIRCECGHNNGFWNYTLDEITQAIGMHEIQAYEKFKEKQNEKKTAAEKQ